MQEIVRGAVEVEREFICESLNCELIGMNASLMTKFQELCFIVKIGNFCFGEIL